MLAVIFKTQDYHQLQKHPAMTLCITWPTNILITMPDGVGAAPYRVLLLSASVQPSVGRLCSHRQLVTIVFKMMDGREFCVF